MRIKISIDAKNMTIPRNYLHMIQGIIYDNLPPAYSADIHENCGFKGFNFSLLNGKFLTTRVPNTHDDLLIFLDTATFYISSIDNDFIMLLCERLSLNGYIMFGNYCARILKIEDASIKVNANKIIVEALSPITIHTTDQGKTTYYNPLDERFFELLNYNFSKKVNSDSRELLKFSKVSNITKVLSKYKSFIIEGYKLTCQIEGNPIYLSQLLELGLGDRNSYGFGMLKSIKH